jgi:hypothetical protein
MARLHFYASPVPGFLPTEGFVVSEKERWARFPDIRDTHR